MRGTKQGVSMFATTLFAVTESRESSDPSAHATRLESRADGVTGCWNSKMRGSFVVPR